VKSKVCAIGVVRTSPCQSSRVSALLPTGNTNVVVNMKFSFLLRLLTLEDGTDTLSRNIGKQLPHDAT
jgi:hypothetical protein